LDAFAALVGEEGPVCCRGGGTRWTVGGASADGTREVRAPAGVVELEPAEMTVRVGAGTTVADLQGALAAVGQRVLLPTGEEGSTVGGVLAVGRADHHRLGWGPVRDRVLEVRYVSGSGRLVKAGGPTVKNVSGFDLARLLVGSLGTLGLIGEVVLRTMPAVEASAWFAGDADPWDVAAVAHRPVALLWDGRRTWVLVEGWTEDVAAQGAALGERGLAPVDGPPAFPPRRWSVDPSTLRAGATSGAWGGAWVAEVGVGVVHATASAPEPELAPAVVELNRRVKARFDPAGRLAPGRDPSLVAS
jgi:glycolate oxidase FAD binding subunit